MMIKVKLPMAQLYITKGPVPHHVHSILFLHNPRFRILPPFAIASRLPTSSTASHRFTPLAPARRFARRAGLPVGAADGQRPGRRRLDGGQSAERADERDEGIYHHCLLLPLGRQRGRCTSDVDKNTMAWADGGQMGKVVCCGDL